MATTESNIYSIKTGETGDVQQAATEQVSEVSHEATLFAEPVFSVGNFTVTNSLINSWLAVLIIIVLSVTIGRSVKKIPGKLQSVAEVVVDGVVNLADSVTNDHKITTKVFPIVFAIFLFVLVNNWLGLIPGIGSIGFIETEGSHSVFVPFLRGGTADINTTLALALFSVIASNIFGFIIVGFWKYFNKFINLQALLEIPGKIWHEPTIIVVNPIKVFVGLIEVVGEFAKVASLSFRLFGNIFAGEVLLASMSALLAFGLPIPFMFLEIIVGLVQAFIFSILILVNGWRWPT